MTAYRLSSVDDTVMSGLKLTPQVGGGGGLLYFSSYVGSGPASTVHPNEISGNSSTPKK